MGSNKNLWDAYFRHWTNPSGASWSIWVLKVALQNMSYTADDRMIIEMIIPARSLIGFHGPFSPWLQALALWVMYFRTMPRWKTLRLPATRSNDIQYERQGTGFSLLTYKSAARCIGPQTAVYEGMIVGLHSKENDLTVNPTRLIK